MPSGKSQRLDDFPYSGPMFASMPLGVVVQDHDGTITHANMAACRILGLTLDQLRGVTSIDPRWQAVHEDGSPFPGQNHPAMRALRTGVPVVHEVMGIINPATHSKTWIRVTATPVRSENGDRIQSVYALFEDITERKQMEAALKDKQEHYRLAVETSNDGFLALDSSGQVVEVNDTYARLSGYSREELLLLTISDLEARESQAQTHAHIQQAMRVGHEMFESEHRAKDGTVWSVEVSVNYSAAGGGRFFAFFRDTRGRRHYEAQARQFESIVHSSQDAIISRSLDGTVTSWNSGAQTLFGYSAEEMIGKPLRVLFPADRETEEGTIVARINHGEKVQHFETVRLKKDGTPIDVSVNIAPIRDVQGQIMGACAIARDITERMHVEHIQAARLRLMTYASNHTLKELLVATLDEAGNLTDSPIGFYHFLEADQCTLNLQAWSTRTTREFCTAAGEGSHYNINEAGVWVECIRMRKPVIHNDYPSLPNKRGLPPGHAPVLREMVVPVFRNGLIVAILGVGNKAVNYGQADMDTVARLADLAWDFTESKRTEEALRQSEERFRQAMDATSDGVWDWNIGDDSEYFSPSYYRMLGYEPGEFPMTRAAWTQRIHADDLARVRACNQECIDNDRPQFEVEYRMLTKSGTWKWVLCRGKVMARDAQGHATRIVGTNVDITERKETELQINFLAYHDQLTGLPNRTLFFDRFSQAISMAKRNGKRVALLFLDLDGFKPVNDQYGHDAGDAVLKIVADRLLSSVRAVDTVARLGGDEFAIILGQLEVPEEARHAAGKLLTSVAQAMSIGEGMEVGVRASIGIGIFPDNGSEMDVLLGKADRAMYLSKESGRDRFTFWNDALATGLIEEGWIQVGDAHLVGFAAIDEQHRHLVDLINALNKSIQAGKDSDEISREFAGLIDYTKFHFATEHALMERHRYPGMQLHDVAHARLLMNVSHFNAMLNRGGDLFVLQSIKDWLLDHIHAEDKQFGAFLKMQ